MSSDDYALLWALYAKGPAKIGSEESSPYRLSVAERLEEAGLVRGVRPEDEAKGGRYFALSGRGVAAL